MIRLDCEQGSAEWFAARLGKPTASMFDKIITPAKMQFSKSSDGYMHQLLAEQILGIALDRVSFGYMQLGAIGEKKAVDWYELKHDVDTERVGFIMRDDEAVGCSPDRFVGNNGLLEIKAPSAPVHVGYLLDKEGIGYRTQVQGQLWLCEREWSDTLSYHPDMPAALVRQNRDEPFIRALGGAVNQFLEMMFDAKLQLQKLGLFPGERVPDLKIA